ncbi:DUF305 domain-containing protein [Patescibacteria group bacterium]|nr:DUF305 domain-containing protein [Patescibacteria group bacterium]
MSKHLLAISLLIVGFIVGMSTGYFFTPQYQETMYQKSMDLGAADRLVDLRYLNAMAAHHRGAILLAKQAEQSQRPEIQSLAATIQKDEPKLIDELYQWKQEWYRDTRKVRDPLSARLGSYDDKLDLRFLNALIAHHEAGILMTQEIRMKSSRAEVLNNADAVENFLKTTGVMLKEWRKAWYNID